MKTIKAEYPDGQGYTWLYFDDRSMKRKHRYVMEQHLGRELGPDEMVHHDDGDRSNNDPSNLRLMTNSAHATYHSTTGRTVVVCSCPGCGGLFRREKRQSHLVKPGNYTACSRKCAGRVSAMLRSRVISIDEIERFNVVKVEVSHTGV